LQLRGIKHTHVLRLGSQHGIGQLFISLAAEGALNKQGKPIDKGYLYRVLNNRVYLGEAVHKGTAYAGEHVAIVGGELWDKAQALIKASPGTRAKRPLGRTAALLKGLVFGSTGVPMTPASTRKGGRLYRYYVSHDVIRTGKSSSPIRRVPAAQIENAVVAQIRELVKSPEIVVATWRVARKTLKGMTERQVREELHRFDSLWAELFPAEQARIVPARHHHCARPHDVHDPWRSQNDHFRR
jgi:site-specific DNA recombinase